MDVVVCDDHRLFGEALATVFTYRGHEIAAFVTDPEDAVSVVAAQPVDVVVMDLRFPDGWGIAAIGAIKEASPSTDVVVLTAYADDATRDRAFGAGARVCVDKLVSLNEVVDVVEQRSVDGYVGLDRRPRQEGSADWSPASLAKFLTPREWQVLKALAQGESTSAIAERLGVGHATARTHVQNLLSKLGVHSRLEAVLFAVEHQLLESDDFGSNERLGA